MGHPMENDVAEARGELSIRSTRMDVESRVNPSGILFRTTRVVAVDMDLVIFEVREIEAPGRELEHMQLAARAMERYCASRAERGR